jgi:two-component system sensor histidine kinase DegS
LTGIALRLETARSLINVDSEKADKRLDDIQNLVAAEQRDLRQHIQSLRPGGSDSGQFDTSLYQRLDDLERRIERHWGLKAKIELSGAMRKLSGNLAHEIYFIVHESITNAARHARANEVLAKIDFEYEAVKILVVDDGRGFSFHGRYDLAELFEKSMGPKTLKERISLLKGSLLVDSTESGSSLTISLPLTKEGE